MSLACPFFHQNKAGQYLSHYLDNHINHLRGGGDLGIQLDSRNEVFDAFKEAYNDAIAFAL
jgi:hypothetical protein